MKHDELLLENECREAARKAGWIAAKLEKNGHKGIPDDLFISPDGRVLLVEFKASKTAFIRKEQKLWAEKFPTLCHIIANKSEFCELLGIL